MPIYEYRCSACGHEVEVIQKMGDRRRRKCPDCDGRMEKLVSRTSFLLKGGGWYAEGYSKGRAKKPSGGDGPEKKQKAAKAKDSGSSASPATSQAAKS